MGATLTSRLTRFAASPSASVRSSTDRLIERAYSRRRISSTTAERRLRSASEPRRARSFRTRGRPHSRASAPRRRPRRTSCARRGKSSAGAPRARPARSSRSPSASGTPLGLASKTRLSLLTRFFTPRSAVHAISNSLASASYDNTRHGRPREFAVLREIPRRRADAGAPDASPGSSAGLLRQRLDQRQAPPGLLPRERPDQLSRGFELGVVEGFERGARGSRTGSSAVLGRTEVRRLRRVRGDPPERRPRLGVLPGRPLRVVHRPLGHRCACARSARSSYAAPAAGTSRRRRDRTAAARNPPRRRASARFRVVVDFGHLSGVPRPGRARGGRLARLCA